MHCLIFSQRILFEKTNVWWYWLHSNVLNNVIDELAENSEKLDSFPAKAVGFRIKFSTNSQKMFKEYKNSEKRIKLCGAEIVYTMV